MPVQAETSYARSGDVAIAYRVYGDGPFDVVYHPGFISHVELMTEKPTSGPHRRARFVVLQADRLRPAWRRDVGSHERRSRARDANGRRACGDGCSRFVACGDLQRQRRSSDELALCCDLPGADERARPRSRLRPIPVGSRLSVGLESEKQRSIVDAYQQLYFRSRRDAAEAMRTVTSGLSDDDLAYLRRAAASPGTIETLATVDREIEARHVLPAVRVPTLVVHAVEDPTFPVGGARYVAGRSPGRSSSRCRGTSPLPSVCSKSRSTSCAVSGKPVAGRSRSRNVCFDHPLHRRRRFDRAGGSAGRSCLARALAASPRAGMAAARHVPGARGRPTSHGFLRASTDRRGRSGALRRSSRACTRWGWRCARVCTQASANCWTGRSRGSPSTPAPALPLGWAGRGACLEHGQGPRRRLGDRLPGQRHTRAERCPDEWRLYAVEQA